MIRSSDPRQSIVAVILGGGRGTRLWPLTKYRAKPAVPLAGKYRLIDIPISNCLNSGIGRIYVLTQFNSDSLNQHIVNTYHMDPFSQGFVALQAASQSDESNDWYQGTADAVKRNLRNIAQWHTPHVLILPGDTIFRMDVREMLAAHIRQSADVTVALHPTERGRAASFGLARLGKDGMISGWAEKPKGDAQTPMELSADERGRFGIAGDMPFLGSMGIYIFKMEVLKEMLRDPQMADFGHDILPAAVAKGRAHGYVFNDFWEDIGTIDAFFQVNLDLARPRPPFSFFYPDAPIYTRMRFLPSTSLGRGEISDSKIADGCQIGDAHLDNCMVGVRSTIGRGVTMRRTVMMGADYYEHGSPQSGYVDVPSDAPGLGIGDGCMIEKAIIDKNARIGPRVIIRDATGKSDYDDPAERYYIRDGVVIVPKHAIVEPGTEI